ncbi:MAG: hypothetical protein HYT89_00245 [Candidatus Omnitrophica bacterium]|nr:hypothetical protein [Candidatus Omnitrophota bacterium]
MTNNRVWILFAGVILVAGLGLFLLYGSRESERNLRLQKELELNTKIAELAQTQSRLASLTEDKKELEETLGAKIGSLNALVKDYDENIKAQTQKAQSATAENQALLSQNKELERRIDELGRRLGDLQREKTDLEDQLRILEKKRRQGRNEAYGPEAEAEEGPGDDEDGARSSEPVRLGNIVIQQASGNAASVQNVNKLYGFIVVNAGTRDGLARDSVLNIVRHKKIVGKAVVEKAKSNMSAAVILPEWTRQEIRIGDLVSLA